MARILIVEDHPVQRDLLAQFLEGNGFEVAQAADGIEGVELARTWQPDLILMGLRMPRMDGVTAIKVLRAAPKTADIPIIVITAWQLQKPRIEAYEAGAEHIFAKPINLSELMPVVNKLLTAAHREHQLFRDKQVNGNKVNSRASRTDNKNRS